MFSKENARETAGRRFDLNGPLTPNATPILPD